MKNYIHFALVLASLLALPACSYADELHDYINPQNPSEYPIPDNVGIVSIFLDLSGAPSDASITKVGIYYEITHPRPSDLDIWITFEDGSGWHDYYLHHFGDLTDQTNIAETRENITAWNDYSPNQRWYLSVMDRVSGQVGHIEFFELWVTYEIPGTNQCPSDPSNPSPANGADNVSITTELNWSCNDPDEDLLYYTVHFGTGYPPPIIKNDQIGSNANPGTLQSGMTYYWYVVADDHNGCSAVNNTAWSFTTETSSNVKPSISISAPSVDTWVGQGHSIRIEWDGTDPDDNALVTLFYDTDCNPENGGWELIIAGRAEDGYYFWNTENVPIGIYKIYAFIDDGNHGIDYGFDCAEGDLNIYDRSQLSISITSPMEGDTYAIGDDISICWTGSHFDNNATVSLAWAIYTKEDVALEWNDIAGSLAMNDCYTWNTEPLPLMGTYYIRACIGITNSVTICTNSISLPISIDFGNVTPQWCDGFEDYSAGTFPTPTWGQLGLGSTISIEEGTSYSGEKCLRVQSGVDVPAIPDISYSVRPFEGGASLTVEMAIKPGIDDIEISDGFGMRAFVNLASSLEHEFFEGLPLFLITEDGGLWLIPLEWPAQNIVSDLMLNNWCKLKIELTDQGWQPDGGIGLWTKCWVDGNMVFSGIRIIENPHFEMLSEIKYLELGCLQGTSWYDDVCIRNLSGPPEEWAEAVEQAQACLWRDPDISCAASVSGLVPIAGYVPQVVSASNTLCQAAAFSQEGDEIRAAIHYVFGIVEVLEAIAAAAGEDLVPLPEGLTAALTCLYAKIEALIDECADGFDFGCFAEIAELDIGGIFSLVLFDSPVKIEILDENGNQISTEIDGGYKIGSGDTPFAFLPAEGHTKYLLIRESLQGTQLRIIGDASAVYPDSTFSLHILRRGVDSTFYSQFTEIPIGSGQIYDYILTESGALSAILIGDIDQDGDYDTLTTWGTIKGSVTTASVGVVGVPINIFDEFGELATSTISDSIGDFMIDSLPKGKYMVSISTPLGYQADEETKEVEVSGLLHQICFELTRRNISICQRGRGYWMHQANSLLSGKGNPHETYEDMCEYMNLIRMHFNEHGLNSVNVFEVVLSDDCTQRLEALRTTISPKPKATMNEKARAQLTALLLNMVSGKIAQWSIVSEDSATISQAITYCNDLITDGLEENDEISKDIAEMINEGQMVPAYWIDPETPDYAYRGINDQQIPTEYSVSQNYPNPFNPSTEISFRLPEASHVKIAVYNILGQKIVNLVDLDYPAGEHKVAWDGRDESGISVTSGIYFYHIEAGEFVDSRKMVLLK